MTLDDVKARLAEIKHNSDYGDFAAAHIKEDDLYKQLLQSIADSSCDNPAACAEEALKSQGFDFFRWCS